MKKLLLCLVLLLLTSCSNEIENKIDRLLNGEKLEDVMRGDVPKYSEYFSRTFEIQDWGEKDTVNLGMKYLGNGVIAYKIFSHSGRLHGLNNITIEDSRGFPLLYICGSYCGFNSVAGGGQETSGQLICSLKKWDEITGSESHISYRAYVKNNKRK